MAFSDYVTSSDKRENGSRLDLGDGDYIVIRSTNTQAYYDALQRIDERNARKGKRSADEMYQELGEALAVLIVDWSLNGFDEYSKENAVEMMTNRDYQEVRTAVHNHAQNTENFRAELVEETEKN